MRACMESSTPAGSGPVLVAGLRLGTVLEVFRRSVHQAVDHSREEVAHAMEQEGQVVIWKPAELATTLWFIYASDRAQDPAIRALLSLLGELWQSPDDAPRGQRGTPERMAPLSRS